MKETERAMPLSALPVIRDREKLLLNIYGTGISLIAISVPLSGFLTAMGLVVALMAAFLLRMSLEEPLRLPEPSSPTYPLLFLIAVAGLSITASIDRTLSACRFAEFLIAAGIFLVFQDYGRRCPEKLSRTALLTLIPFSLVLFFAVLQCTVGASDFLLSGDRASGWFIGRERIRSVFDDPNICALYLVLFIPFILGIAVLNNRKDLSAVLVPLGLFCLFLTFSRNGWLSMIASTVFILFLPWNKHMKKQKNALLLLILCSAMLLIPVQLKRFHTLFVWSPCETGRVEIYKTSLDIIKDKPVSGVGYGNFRTAFPLYFKAPFILYEETAQWSAHNMLLHITAETGLAGGAAWLWFNAALIIGLFRRSGRTGERGILIRYSLWGIMALTIFGILDSTINHGQCGYAFFMVAGCAMGCSRETAVSPDLPVEELL